MKKNNYLILDDEFIKYCELNNIQDIEKFAKEVFTKGFTSIKYDREPKIPKPLVDGIMKKNVKEVITNTQAPPPPPPPIPPVNKVYVEGNISVKPKNIETNLYDE
jgi:hypothetical protein